MIAVKLIGDRRPALALPDFREQEALFDADVAEQSAPEFRVRNFIDGPIVPERDVEQRIEPLMIAGQQSFEVSRYAHDDVSQALSATQPSRRMTKVMSELGF